MLARSMSLASPSFSVGDLVIVLEDTIMLSRSANDFSMIDFSMSSTPKMLLIYPTDALIVLDFDDDDCLVMTRTLDVGWIVKCDLVLKAPTVDCVNQ